MLMFWLLISFVPPFVGYFLGKVSPSKLRLSLLLLFLSVPPLAFTTWMATAEPAPGGFFLWWWIGMGLTLVPEVIWATGTMVGFAMGKRSVR